MKRGNWGQLAALVLSAIGAAFGFVSVHAQQFPSKNISILSTFQLGGAPEVPLRLITEDITKRTGRTFVLESRPGGGGAVGLTALHRAEADGHTLAYTFTGALLVNPYTTPDLGWNPTSFSPVGRIFFSPIIFVGDTKFPARNFADVIRIARQKPESVSIAIGGSGNKIGLAQIEAATGVKFLWVPVTNQPRVNVLGGHTNLGIETPASVKGLVEEGKITAIAMGSLTRFDYMPNVPTVSETVPGFENGFWFGFLAPPGTPADRVAWLNREINASATSPAIAAKLKELALQPIVETPQQNDAYLRKTGPEFEKIIRAHNIN
jgi:tripartite-type tricarboxylate transporter receptor subunit TctC